MTTFKQKCQNQLAKAADAQMRLISDHIENLRAAIIAKDQEAIHTLKNAARLLGQAFFLIRLTRYLDQTDDAQLSGKEMADTLLLLAKMHNQRHSEMLNRLARAIDEPAFSAEGYQTLLAFHLAVINAAADFQEQLDDMQGETK